MFGLRCAGGASEAEAIGALTDSLERGLAADRGKQLRGQVRAGLDLRLLFSELVEARAKNMMEPENGNAPHDVEMALFIRRLYC